MRIIDNIPVWREPIDDGALKQLKTCDYIFGQAAMMADHHSGYGVPIGGVARTAEQVFIPYTVGGGMRTADDIRAMLQAGCDKISLNSAAVREPALITRTSGIYGSQCIVVAIDARRVAGATERWEVFINGGRINTRFDAIEWVREVERLGAGEILLTSMDRDGTNIGYDIPLTRAVTRAVNLPVIASGGAGELDHFAEVVVEADADAVLAASTLHYGKFTVRQVKEHMAGHGIPVRL